MTSRNALCETEASTRTARARAPNLGRSAALIAIFVAMAFGDSACDGVRAVTCSVGLCDEPPKPAEWVDVLCDASAGSSCNRQTLEQALDVVLHHVGDRAGSHVRLWLLGATVASTVVVGEQIIPPVPRGSERVKGTSVARISASARDVLLSAAAHAFEAPPIRCSPIAEALSKIALADAAGLPRRLVVLTDGREMSAFADLECGCVPTAEQFSGVLRHLNVLAPGQLAGVGVELAYVTASVVPDRGCAVTIDREVRIRGLWTYALRAAGAAPIRIGLGPPLLGDFDGGDAGSDGGGR